MSNHTNNTPDTSAIIDALIEEHSPRFSAEVLALWCDNLHEKEPTANTLSQCEEAYIGSFRDFTRLAEHLVDESGMLYNIPSEVANYFDYEKYGNDLRLGGDVWESDGHFFRNI